MKAVRLHAYGGPEALIYEDAPAPEPGPGEVRIRVQAAGINPFDWKLRSGKFKDMMPLPLPAILGGDVAGVVESVGPDVTVWRLGDEVYGAAEFPRAGSYAELALALAEKIGRKPRTLDFARTAAVPTPALTAWQALFEAGALGVGKAGQTVLIHGIGGAVGRMALQLAKQAGARVLGTASASAREELLKLGADVVIDYHAERFEDVAHDVDLVLDGVGGETQARSFAVLKPGGALIALTQPPSEEAAKARGVRASIMFARPDRAAYEQIAARIDAGKLDVRPAVVVPLSEAASGHAMAESGKASKVVLRVGD